MLKRYINLRVLMLFLLISKGSIGNNPNTNSLFTDKKPHTSKSLMASDQAATMGFEENKGQFVDEQNNRMDNLLYRFKARDLDIYLTTTGVSYVFYKSSHKHVPEAEKDHSEKDSIQYNRVDVDLVNANISLLNVVAEDPLEQITNYFTAVSPRGITNVKQYQKITIRNVYEGIDWVWYVTNGSEKKMIKYDFIVHPNADPANIKLLYKWADISQQQDDQLIIKTPIGELQEGKAISYAGGNEIQTAYQLNKNVVSFKLGDYDHSQTLTIDPPLNLVWGTYFGGNAWEKNTDMSNAIDANGNVFVTGNTLSSSAFPNINPGGGAYFQGTYGGGGGIQGKGGDICILKFSNLGALIWCTYYGGTDHDNGNSVSIDNAGNVYVAGSSLSTNFPLMNLSGAFNQGVYAGGSNAMSEGGDAVLIKFTNTGVLLWSTFYGGSGNDVARGVVADGNGNVFMTGWTESTNFPLNNPGAGAYYQGTNGGGKDGFLVKFSSTGQQLWSTFYGGNASDIAHYITTDVTNKIYVIGETSSTNFPLLNPGSGAYYQAANAGASDAFIFKASNTGVSIWSTYYGGGGVDIGRGINVHSLGSIYIAGQTQSTNFPTLNPGGGAFFQAANAGMEDAFFARFLNGGNLVWSTYYGGSSDDDGTAIVSDNCGNFYATGNTFSTDLQTVNPGNGAFYIPNKLTSDDVYFVGFNANNALIWATYNGTTGFDEKGTSLKVDPFGNLFIVGYWCFYSNSNGYMAVNGAYNKTNMNADDFFIAKFKIADCALLPYNVSLCFGTSTVISINNINNLANPVYSIQPSGLTQSSPNFTVSPSANTTYTLFVTGTNSSNFVLTNSIVVNATVFPAPIINSMVNQGSCSNPTNNVTIGVTFTPSGSPNYTTTWSPLPANYSTVNSATASGLQPGPNSATVITSDGCRSITNFTINAVQLPADFIVINPSNDYTIRCNNPNVLLTTSVTNGNPLSFIWSPCTPTVSGPSYNFTTACVGTVIGISATGCNVVRSYTVYQDVTAPVVAVTPTIMNITCNVAASTFTGTSTLGPNVTTNWYQVVGTNTMYVGVPQGTINLFQPGSPGIYWFESINNLTGCRDTKSVQVTASIGVPQFTVTSTTNFTVGCSTKSVTSMQVTYVETSPNPNTPVEYFFSPPPGTLTPGYNVNPNQNNIVTPGTWVVYVRDQTNMCVVTQSINIIQNIIPPPIEIIQPLSILTCKNPTMELTGISNNLNTIITWTVPAVPSNSVNPTPNATVVINPTISNSSVNITSVGIYTVGAIDNNNLCRSSKTVQILQDIRVPIFVISALTNSVLTCINHDVLLVPITTTALAGALIPTYEWSPPVGLPSGGSSFNSTIAGSHTSIATSIVNGCTYTATYIIGTDINPPPLQLAPIFTLDCAPNPTVAVFPTITGTTTGFAYSWSVPPGALTSNLTSSVLVTNKSGDYFVTVTNTINGCMAQTGIEIMDGSIYADFIASPNAGFAPLAVTFSNTSVTSTGASSIISTWSYGNGTITHTVFNTAPTMATYTASGTYSVILSVQKGSCIDSAMHLILVELPSKLEVPNVFTPNGDKSNDIFRLRATNLAHIEIVIFDRWGNRVYEVVSETGNFAWDGKNLSGKDCPAGTYFYMINARGKDEAVFEQKGNVSLFR